jgi:hypothetical protein
MITFDLDEPKNFIIIKMFGKISIDDASNNLNNFTNLCRKLSDCFTIINDISGLSIDSEAELVTINKINRKIFELFKVGKVIRVVGKSKPILMKLSKIDKNFNLKDIYYVPTLKEAIALAGKEKQNCEN